MLQEARWCGQSSVARRRCAERSELHYPFRCNVVAVGAGGGNSVGLFHKEKRRAISLGADVAEGQIVVSSDSFKSIEKHALPSCTQQAMEWNECQKWEVRRGSEAKLTSPQSIRLPETLKLDKDGEGQVPIILHNVRHAQWLFPRTNTTTPLNFSMSSNRIL